MLFQELWRINDDNLPIARHHGSLDAASAGGWRRPWRKTASRRRRDLDLDLGLDWGDVDLVIHIGAPKGASRLAQRIGRFQSPHGRAEQGHSRARQPFSR